MVWNAASRFIRNKGNRKGGGKGSQGNDKGSGKGNRPYNGFQKKPFNPKGKGKNKGKKGGGKGKWS